MLVVVDLGMPLFLRVMPFEPCTMVPERDVAYAWTVHLDFCRENALGAGVGVREPLGDVKVNVTKRPQGH